MDLPVKNLGIGLTPALIVVDMSLAFTDPSSPLGFECNDTISVNKKIIGSFRKKGLPIFYITTVYREDREAHIFRKRLPDLDILVPDSEWIKIHPELSPLTSETIIEKKFASGFFETNLYKDLLEQEVDSIVVTGLTTSGCVRATAVDGLQHNLSVIVVEDAVNDRNISAHIGNLKDLDLKYADVLNYDKTMSLIT
tara:strand:- start:348 stop:935 length:588 start_codon:yes stop_codon:yes gene_type:complete